MMDLFEAEQKIYDDAIARIEMVRAGAPFDFEEFAAFAKEYGKLLKQLRRATRIADRTSSSLHESTIDLTDKARTDALTGIYNRRYMEERLTKIIKSMSRYYDPLTVMMIDIDYFKKYNDTYGHQAGDECIKAVARTLSESAAREDDFVARYGGEEFVLVLPHTDAEGARLIADKLLESIRSLNIPHEKNDAASCVTISIGVTTVILKHTHKSADYIKTADAALYMSKQSGRNKYTYLEFKGEANGSAAKGES